MKLWVIGVALAGVLAATMAQAGSAPPSDKLDLPLEGAQTSAIANVPSNDQMQREYPPLALTLNLGGSGTITCTVETTGLLSDCKLDSEGPAGLGFGAAALRLAPYFTAKPPTFEGKPVKGVITIPIRFQTAEFHPPPPVQIATPTSPAALDAAREIAALEQWAPNMRTATDQTLSQLTAQTVAGGDAVDSARIVDALRLGLDDAIAEEIDERERALAADMTANQLRAVVVFLKTPAGLAMTRVRRELETPGKSTFWAKMTAAARKRLCAQGGCPE